MKTAIYTCMTADYLPLFLIFSDSYFRKSELVGKHDFYLFTPSQDMIDFFNSEPAFWWVKPRLVSPVQADNPSDWTDEFYYGVSLKIKALQALYGEYERVLHIDIDTVITGSLEPLVSLNMHGKACAGVPDLAFHRWQQVRVTDERVASFVEQRDKLCGVGEAYINSGVFLVDCTVNIELPDYDTFAREWKTDCVDQDWLNYAYQDNILVIDETWNYLPDMAFTEQMTGQRKMIESILMSMARIQHFYGASKPWRFAEFGHILSDHIHYGAFLEVYNNCAPWFRTVPEFNWLTGPVDEYMDRMISVTDMADKFASYLEKQNKRITEFRIVE